MKLQHLEYSVILHTCRLGDRVRKATNPFTGDAVEFPIDNGLSAVERRAVQGLFGKWGVQGPEANFEGYALYVPGNGSVRFRIGDIEDVKPPLTSFTVEIVVKMLSDELLTLVLDVARQGNMAFMSPTGENVCLVKKSSDSKIKKRWPDTTIMQTTDDLRLWLETKIGGRKVRSPQAR